MKNMRIGLTLAIFALILIAIPSALAVRPHYIYDNANVVDTRMEGYINEFGTLCDQATTAEIVIVTLQALPQGKSVEETKLYYFNDVPLDGVKGIGKAGKNNGVLILLVMDSHDWAIETGYGVEGQLTDAECGRIGRDIMTPYFKDGKFGEGLYLGMKAVGVKLGFDASITMTDTTGSVTNPLPPIDITWLIIIGAVLLIIIIIVIIVASDGEFGGGSYGGSHSGGSGGGGFGGGGSGGGGGGGHWDVDKDKEKPIDPTTLAAGIIAGVAVANLTKERKFELSKLSVDGSHYCDTCKDTESYHTRETHYDSKDVTCLNCGTDYNIYVPRPQITTHEERHESRRSSDDDSYSHSHDSGSHSGGYGGSHGGGSFGGGSSGGGGARGKW